MSAFLSKIFAFFLSKIAKNAVFGFCCEISIAKVWLRYNLLRKSSSAIAELRCALMNKFIEEVALRFRS